jgi:hypothetical protein
LNRYEVAACVALAVVIALAGVALWRRLRGDDAGAVASLIGAAIGVAAAVLALFLGQRRRTEEAEAKADDAAKKAKTETVRAEVAAIETAETRDLSAIQVDTARDVTRIEIDGERAKATGPAAGELEDIVARYKKEHPE